MKVGLLKLNYISHGLSISNPWMFSKSFVLHVTSLRLCTNAEAAIKVSTAGKFVEAHM
jgi:hypothetical protein